MCINKAPRGTCEKNVHKFICFKSIWSLGSQIYFAVKVIASWLLLVLHGKIFDLLPRGFCGIGGRSEHGFLLQTCFSLECCLWIVSAVLRSFIFSESVVIWEYVWRTLQFEDIVKLKNVSSKQERKIK